MVMFSSFGLQMVPRLVAISGNNCNVATPDVLSQTADFASKRQQDSQVAGTKLKKSNKGFKKYKQFNYEDQAMFSISQMRVPPQPVKKSANR